MRLAWESIKADRVLRLALIGQIFVWTIATLVPPPIMAYDATHLGLKNWQSGLPLAALGIGIGVGLPAGGQAVGVEGGIWPAAVGCARSDPDARWPSPRSGPASPARSS